MLAPSGGKWRVSAERGLFEAEYYFFSTLFHPVFRSMNIPSRYYSGFAFRPRCITFIPVLVLVLLPLIAAHSVHAEKPLYLSPIALAADRDGKTLYVAEATARSVAVFDIATEVVVKVIPLKEQPTGVALSPDGARLYVTCSTPKGTVEIIDTKSGRLERTVTAGHTSCSPVVAPDGRTLYVCNRFDKTVYAIDCVTGRVTKSISVLREPVAAALTPDGKRLFIANHLPSGEVIYDYVSDGGIMMVGSYISTGYYSGTREKYAASCVVLVADTKRGKLDELIMLPTGSTGARGLCVSPDGRYVYVTHVLAHYQLPTTQLDRGWINTNALSIIDAVRMELVATILLDDLDRGAANPWGVVCSADGSYLCVSHAGTHEISVIDRGGLHERLDKLARGEAVPCAAKTLEDTPNDLTFLTGLRHRITLGGKGPRGLACIGTRVFAAEYFTDTVGIIDIETGGVGGARSVALGLSKPLTPKRAGELYFNDAGLCFQQWQSCASCHPDGRMDALNWDLLNDGVGNPKNTRSLLLSHRTPPVMITGIRRDAETAVRAGMKYIQFSMPEEDAAAAIDAYLGSLEPVRSPYLENGRLSKGARRGRAFFRRAGCSTCHPSPLFTDLKQYDVGAGAGRERGVAFDTPTLVELWRTAPYLYDGRTDGLYLILTNYNRKDMHGATSRLGNLDLYDLIEYLLSL